MAPRLFSKVQFNNFEEGEFVNGSNRNYDETIGLIEDFPWNKERVKLEVNLTNPSITIEGKHDTFLKFAVYFNNKFVLHFLNDKDELFTKSFFEKQDAYTYIHSYFEDCLDLNVFKKEYTWLRHNKPHFVSQDFNYSVTSRTALRFLLSKSWINLIFGIFCLVTIPSISFNKVGILGEVFIALFAFSIGGGLNIVFLLNHYHYAKDKMLIMSKGNSIFYFGSKKCPEQFSKTDITEVIVFKDRNSRSPLRDFVVVQLILKNGRTLRIPSLFIDDYKLLNKLSGIPSTEKSSWPIL